MTEESDRAAEQAAEDFRHRHHHHHFPDEWIAECAYYISIGENPSNIEPSDPVANWFNAETWLGWNHHEPSA